jgi:hypothetical protein
MQRFDRYAAALQGALRETPEALQAGGVDGAVDVAFGVVDDV